MATGEVPPKLVWSSPRDVIWAEWRAWFGPWLGRLVGGRRTVWVALGCVAVYAAAMYTWVGPIPVRSWVALAVMGPLLAATLALDPVWRFIRGMHHHALPPVRPGWTLHRVEGGVATATRLDDFDGFRLRDHALVARCKVVDLHTRNGWWRHPYPLPEGDPTPLEAIRRWLPERDVADGEVDPAETYRAQFEERDESLGAMARRRSSPIGTSGRKAMALASVALGVLAGRLATWTPWMVWLVLPLLVAAVAVGPGTIWVVWFDGSSIDRVERWRLLWMRPRERPTELRAAVLELERVQVLGNLAFALAASMTYQVLAPR